MVNICAFLMNLNTETTRLASFQSAFGSRYFTRIPAVTADSFHHRGYPCLPGGTSHGSYKALQATMVKTMHVALKNKTCEYAVIFEDDAIPDASFWGKMQSSLSRHNFPDVLYLDSRNGGGAPGLQYIPSCCLIATVYNRRAMRYLSAVMDWKTSPLMKYYGLLNLPIVKHPDCLNDWTQANFLGMTNLKVRSQPFVRGHGVFKSQVNQNTQRGI